MNNTDLLSQIIEELEQRDIELQGATHHELRAFAETVEAATRAKLPSAYQVLLAQANGFSHNAVHFLGIDETPTANSFGFLEQNYQIETQNPWQDHFLVFAITPTWYYALHIESGTYQAIDRKTWQSDCEFESFEEMIAYPLREALNMFEVEEAVG